MQLLTDFLQPGKILFRRKEYDPKAVSAGIESVARYLRDNIVSNSPFVYLFASNHIKTVFSYFGIIKARRICVLIDPKIGRIELEEMMQDTPPAACIRIDTIAEAFDFSKEIELRKQLWKDDPNEDLSDVCTMIYTAADDGYAKAAMLTHDNILADARGIIDAEKLNSKTISCGLSPFNHLYPLQGGVIAPLLVESNIFIQDVSKVENISSITAEIEQVGLTHLYSVPAIYFIFSKVNDIAEKFKSLMSVGSGGYKLSNAIYLRFLQRTGKEIHEGYGISEASPVCTWTYNKVKIDTVGTSFPCCTIGIISDSGFFSSKNQQGEICIKGSNIMKGYYKKSDETKRVLINGWMHTGDLGYIDNEGYIHLIKSKKRMINHGGKKIYPAEVERLVKKNPNVLDIEVFGTDDCLSGQKVEAKIHLKENSNQAKNELKRWCQCNISNYKIFSKAEFYSILFYFICFI